MSDIFEIAKSIQAVSVQGLKAGGEIVEAKYRPIVERLERENAELKKRVSELENLIHDRVLEDHP